MGQIEIIEKLDKELKKEVHGECYVVYILSRIRKILEIKNQKGKYRFLNFYCSWVLHSKLDYKSTTILLADLFESDVNCGKSGKDNAKKIKYNHSEFFKLSTLKQELDIFLKDNSLPVDLVNKNWAPFRKFLLAIIKECPIIFDSKKLRQMELIKDGAGNYCYKFDIIGNRQKPMIKLKFK
jgi:hypothetical protein